ncbi:hypothetical protein DLM85_17580 [Hymenobacter edaphi]|uniref:Uncharacterized protein n=1 Tax=Hymenobacter edaphi TaxID=2211146 RepID=A0A328BHE6_9BACT|nr:hypothetical protein DLM85_17580 [Hymenobacter edaphi]
MSRLAAATHRGEYLCLDESLLVLPLVAEPPASWDLLDRREPGLLEDLRDLLRDVEDWWLSLQNMFSDAARPVVIGTLVLSPEAAYRELDGQWEQQLLSAATPLRLGYYGYSPEPYQSARYGSGPR